MTLEEARLDFIQAQNVEVEKRAGLYPSPG